MSTDTTVKSQHYDYIIIGSGSGNTIIDQDFSNSTIALIDSGIFGGTCLNVGCIPTKMYVYAADVAYASAHSSHLSIHTSFEGVDWEAIKNRVFSQRIDPISEGGKSWRAGDENPNLDLYTERAQFIGERTLQVGEKVITGDTIILATGSRPFIPEIIAQSGVKYRTNEDIMRMKKLPSRLTILGGGYIAAEFAHVFSSLGVEVHLINRSEHLLRHLDSEISQAFTAIATEEWNTYLGRSLSTLENQKDGSILITLDDGTTVESDELLVATGRIPNSDFLNPGAAGIELRDPESPFSKIKVDEYGRTTAPGIWALGDISSPYDLKHVANAEARVIKNNVLHPEKLIPFNHDHVPSAVFTHPQIATVGMTEEEARLAGLPLTIKVQRYADIAYGWAMEDTTGLCKLIANKETGTLLGAHIMGPQASTLIQQLITIMHFNLPLSEVARGEYWPHPGLSELIENAILGLELPSQEN